MREVVRPGSTGHPLYACSSFRAEADERGRPQLWSPDGDSLARLNRYEATLALIRDLRAPLTDDGWLRVSNTDGLFVGDAIELRNEYQMARANFPAIHPCEILELTRDAVRIEPASLRPVFGQQGTFLSKRTRVAADAFTVEDGSAKLRGQGGEIDVELDFAFSDEPGELVVCATRHFGRDALVLSERLVFDGLPPLREVYRKNRKLDVGGAFQRAYHLDREGADFRHESGSGIYTYGAREISSLAIVKPAARFTLTAETPVRRPPNDPMAAVTGDLNSYASFDAPSDGGKIVLLLDLDGMTAVEGLRVLWYRPEDRPQAIRALASSGDGAWEPLLERELGAADDPLDVLATDKGVISNRLRLEVTPRPSQRLVAVRTLDVLVGGEGFELHAILDDHRDHRYCRFVEPDLRTPEMGRLVMESRSGSQRRAGDSVTAALSLFVGTFASPRIRISHVPHAARALLVWTEHADRTTLASHRAANHGDERITDPREAVGGFVGHGIPVTRSVFVDNPRGSVCCKAHPVPQAALRSDPAFSELCRALADHGHEICVHAPWPTNSPPETGPEAAEFIAQEYGARTWIDHSAAVVHCGMSGQGLVPESPYNMAAVWARTGHRWFWQFACEDANDQRVGSINVQQVRLGDAQHTPLFWRHPAETGDFLSWATVRGGDLDVYTDAALDQLVEDRGVCITHTYPAAHYDDPERNQYLAYAFDGRLITSTRFEDVLRRLEARVSTGELLAVTVRDAMAYWEAIEGLEIHRGGDGDTVLVNGHSSAIDGFTLVVRGPAEPHTGLGARTVTVDDDVLITFRFPAESAIRVLARPTGIELVPSTISR